jgi:hypothetical protein
MGTTVYVRDFRGAVLQRGVVDMQDLLDRARQAHLPLLGIVDEYDDTIFNGMQVSVVVRELGALAGDDALKPALEELEAMAGVVQERPHRYLVFNGD